MQCRTVEEYVELILSILNSPFHCIQSVRPNGRVNVKSLLSLKLTVEIRLEQIFIEAPIAPWQKIQSSAHSEIRNFFNRLDLFRYSSSIFAAAKKANFPLRVRHTRFRFECFQSTAPSNTNWRHSRREQWFYTLNLSRTVKSEHWCKRCHIAEWQSGEISIFQWRTRCWRLCWCSKTRFSQRGSPAMR